MTQKRLMRHVVGNLSILIFSITAIILVTSISQSFGFELYTGHPTSTITVHPDKSSYNQGDMVIISGIVSGVSPSYQYQEPSGKVSLLLYNDKYVFENILVDVSPNGVYSYQFKATNPGMYQIFATYQDASGQGTFKVGSKSNEIPQISTVSIQTDKSLYILGEQVKISGKITGIVPGLQISLVLVNEDLYKSYNSTFLSVSSDGSYSYQYVPLERGKIDAVASYNYEIISTRYIIK